MFNFNLANDIDRQGNSVYRFNPTSDTASFGRLTFLSFGQLAWINGEYFYKASKFKGNTLRTMSLTENLTHLLEDVYFRFFP